MCLILFALDAHPDYSLVVAANRDEFFNRPTDPIGWWDEYPNILGGRDKAEVIGSPGTWMALSKTGKFAALTNVRSPNDKDATLKTRGELCAEYLSSNLSPSNFVDKDPLRFSQYNGFNLLMGDFSNTKRPQLNWLTNRNLINGTITPAVIAKPILVNPGIYGVSNAMLNTPWPKITKNIPKFSNILKKDYGDFSIAEEYLELLSEASIAPDIELPNTGVSLEWERILSSAFIKTRDYGTRSTSLLRVKRDGKFQLIEKRFGPEGEIDLNEISGDFI